MRNPPLEKIELNAEVNGKSERVISLTFGLTVYFPIPFSAQLEAIHHVFDTYLERIPWSTFKFQNPSGTSKGYKKVAASSRRTIVDRFEKKRRMEASATSGSRTGIRNRRRRQSI
jgi:hypothetical protein